MAINEINNKNDGIFDDILPDVHVRYGCRDSLHTFQHSVLAAIDLTQNQFMPNGVNAVIGAGDSFVSEALAQVLQRSNVPQISYGSGSTELSHSDLYPTFLRVYPSDAYQGTAMADIIANTLKFQRMSRHIHHHTNTDTSQPLLIMTSYFNPHNQISLCWFPPHSTLTVYYYS